MPVVERYDDTQETIPQEMGNTLYYVNITLVLS